MVFFAELESKSGAIFQLPSLKKTYLRRKGTTQ